VGKTHSEETLKKMSAALGTAVEVIDTETSVTTTYSSKCQAAKALNCGESTVRRYVNSQKLYEGRYQIKIKG